MVHGSWPVLLNELPPVRVVSRRSKGSSRPRDRYVFLTITTNFPILAPISGIIFDDTIFFTDVQNRLARSLRVVARTLQINGGTGVGELKRLDESLDRGKLARYRARRRGSTRRAQSLDSIVQMSWILCGH